MLLAGPGGRPPAPADHRRPRGARPPAVASHERRAGRDSQQSSRRDQRTRHDVARTQDGTPPSLGGRSRTAGILDRQPNRLSLCCGLRTPTTSARFSCVGVAQVSASLVVRLENHGGKTLALSFKSTAGRLWPCRPARSSAWPRVQWRDARAWAHRVSDSTHARPIQSTSAPRTRGRCAARC